MGFGGGFGRVGTLGLVTGALSLDLTSLLLSLSSAITLLVIILSLSIFSSDLIIAGPLNNAEVSDADMIMLVRDLMTDTESSGRTLALTWGDFLSSLVSTEDDDSCFFSGVSTTVATGAVFFGGLETSAICSVELSGESFPLRRKLLKNDVIPFLPLLLSLLPLLSTKSS